jgi:hypothetical protein
VRVEDLDRQAVQRALWEERTLVKTWAMRGTLHLLPNGDSPLWRLEKLTLRILAALFVRLGASRNSFRVADYYRPIF